MKAWFMEHRFALAELVGRVRRQPFSTLLNVLVVAIALALPLAGYVFLKNLQPLTESFAATPEISVFMRFEASRDQAQQLGVALKALPGVSNARLIPREEALARLKDRTGMADIIGALPTNPLPDAWVIQFDRATQATRQTRDALANQIRTLPNVDHVQTDSAWMQRIEALIRFSKLGLIFAASLLAAAVVTVIFNTIRLQVVMHQEEIEVIQLMGATNRFIRRPFYYSGILQGLVGGALAISLMHAFAQPMGEALSDLIRLLSPTFVFNLLTPFETAAALAISATLGGLAAGFSVHQHLWQRGK